MKKLFYLVTLFCFSFLIFSSWAKDSRRPLGSELKTQLMKVFEQNEKLHAAMFKYNKEKLVQETTLFKKLLREIKASDLSKQLTPALSSADELISSQDKAKDNESYHRLSLVLVKIIESYNLGSTYNIFYCPMVKKRWVQNSQKMKKVHNPYAPEMPHCGGQISEF
jgi:ribonucleotide reductase beta subunit family protein with ferritin-like domain